ncbi:serine/threonine-protein phosphatase [Flexivirga sp. ID2601S]|uniref:Serine/threonine-protein phosphatase n=1 Tax=Flexivirga aerilata TaxID=1656889 RepID=A0A849AF22_9MICO|nr:PP2C family protein-serine/threonine phosphatase [Flexivirga aerilata]NNG39454.1 serine/threonine-protein phosphatase [Flexivirga aerilata]
MAIDLSLAPRRLTRAHGPSAAEPTRIGPCAPALVSLAAAVLLVTLAWPWAASYALFIPIAVAAGMLLPRRQAAFVFGCLGVAYVVSVVQTGQPGAVSMGLVLLATMALVTVVDRRHTRAGVSPAVGNDMLLDLRERLRAQGRLPVLPTGWNVEASVQPAYGDSFSGDFVVGNCPTPDRFELALVDVSGKGCTAGTRSLLLGGAFAGLLGAMEPRRFLPAANDYLVRQGWSEGFATAVHASVDLATGDYSIGSAGHPPAMHFRAGSGRFAPVTGASGMLLGVLERQGPDDFVRAHGRLARGDALLFVTDGVIEQPGVDLMQGVDRMLGYADREMTTGVRGAATRICNVGSGGDADDRAVVVIWRE